MMIAFKHAKACCVIPMTLKQAIQSCHPAIPVTLAHLILLFSQAVLKFKPEF
jgi:hypothetical protein